MSLNKQYEEKTEAFLIPILDEEGFELVDVEYVKEGSDYYLRAFIDKPGGITIDDCVLVSRKMNEILDREDYIADAYTFEVSSPGLMRPLKKDKDYERALGKMIDIHTYVPIDKQKEFTGTLREYDNDSVTVETDNGNVTFNKKDISLIRLAFVD